jgi:hypothetical protein
MWDGIKALVAEIKTCEQVGATASAVAMAYICIDTMAFLSLPVDRVTQGRADFIEWVDAYLKGEPEQPYQYRGIDVYGARCAVLHAFGSDVDFHEKNVDTKKFGYHDGGKHAYDSTVDDRLVIIGTASFINDVLHAVTAFMDACQADPGLRKRVETRLPKVLATFPISA